jgi:uroporphyrinogen-III synthase
VSMENELLSGWRILVTRAGKQAEGLSDPLRRLGATVIEIPTIEIKPAGSYSDLDNALLEIDQYDTLILTSVNGVEVFFDRYNRMGLPILDMEHLRVVAIGPATAAAIQSAGLAVSVVPEKYVAESVVEALRGKIDASSRVLLVRAKIARDVLPNELEKMGARVDVIEAYETVVPENAKEKLEELLSDPMTRPHVITFTSSSTASNFLSLVGKNASAFLDGVHLAAIGPVTAETLKKAEFPPDIEAGQYTMPGLVEAICDYAGRQDPNEKRLHRVK